MGHAGAIVSTVGESTAEKVEILKGCAVTIVERPSEFAWVVGRILDRTVRPRPDGAWASPNRPCCHSLVSMREILSDLERWHRQGRSVALARVIDLEGSGPRLPGATMAVADDGEVAGSVSGGCVEGAVVTEALDVLDSGDRRLVSFGYSDDEAFAVGLTCGGTIHLFIEPLDW